MQTLPAIQQMQVILVVDDTPANLTLMRNLLQPEGYKVLITTSGEKALQLVEKITPDLIMLDIMMPGLDGFETLAILQEMPQAKDIPVIFITARSDLHDLVKGFELGAVDYITKPIQRLEVLARTRAHLKIQQLLKIERNQSEKIRAVINNMTDCVIVIDQHGNIESANPATELLFQYSGQTMCQMHIAQLLNYDGDPASFVGVLQHSHTEDLWWKQPRGQASNGLQFPIEISVKEMFTHEPHFVIVIQDISVHFKEIAQLHHLSETDPLTNINNRRYFEILLSQSWLQCKRSLQPYTLLFIDIDRFKAFNDHYGHQTGDTCLKQVANALATALPRASDSVSRYGGEEFVSILPDTAVEGGLSVAENLRQAVYQLAIEHLYSEHNRITVSIGMACWQAQSNSSPKDNLEINAVDLLKRADNALYSAKSQGRNRVVLFES